MDPIAYYEENGERLVANAAKAQAQQAKKNASDYAEWSRLIASTGGRIITDLSAEQYKEFVMQSAVATLAANNYLETQICGL